MPVRLGQLEILADLNEIVGPAGRHRLEPQAMTVLELLVGEPGKVWSRDELLYSAWPGRVVSDATLTGAISRLRSGLREVGVNDVQIETRSKRGYRLTVANAGMRERPVPGSAWGSLTVLLVVIVVVAGMLAKHNADGRKPEAKYLRVEFNVVRPYGQTVAPVIMLEPDRTGELLVGEENPLRVKVSATPAEGRTVRLRYEIAALAEWGIFELTTPFGVVNRFSMPAASGRYEISVTVDPVALHLEPAAFDEN